VGDFPPPFPPFEWEADADVTVGRVSEDAEADEAPVAVMKEPVPVGSEGFEWVELTTEFPFPFPSPMLFRIPPTPPSVDCEEDVGEGPPWVPLPPLRPPDWVADADAEGEPDEDVEPDAVLEGPFPEEEADARLVESPREFPLTVLLPPTLSPFD
jgi:hypothetical protein